MSMLRNILATGLITMTVAVASISATTPAFAHGNGGGGGHGGGFGGGFGGGHFSGEHFGGGLSMNDRHFDGGRSFAFAHDRHDHFRRGPFFGFFDNDDDYLDYCQLTWTHDRLGHPREVEVCS
ncbi:MULTISPECIES: hypothetical protein [unclassified Sinorhizobium]|uniref:hypothetical protein n=1 Tax=unclassified Sinorhizobium TaxID=2613772 RepID=UPI003524CD96